MSNNLPLFDIADIESHRADGTPVTEGGKEALAGEWSSDGGHLNESGSARAAGAMWWLMAQIGGWTSGTGGAGGQGGAASAGGRMAGTGGSAAGTEKSSSGCSYAGPGVRTKERTTFLGLAAAAFFLAVARRRRR